MSQSQAELVEAVRRVPLMRSLSDQGLEHYARAGLSLRVDRGGHIAKEGDTSSWFHLLLAGRVDWSRRLNGADVHVLTHTPGDYFGHEPVLLDIPVPVTGLAREHCWMLRLEADKFWELLSSCPEIRRELLSTVTQRFGTLESVSQQQAKLVSLGTMAAGLAHELNNPAAAVRSGAAALGRVLADLADQAPAGVGALYRDAAHLLGADGGGHSGGRDFDLNADVDAEDEVGDWLDRAGVSDPWEAAPLLVRAGVTGPALDGLAGGRPPDAVHTEAAWLAAHLRARDALAEIGDGAARIGDLVAAMRDYTYLDQGPLQHLDVTKSLESTLTILGHKLRRGAVELVRDYASDLPPVPAHGSELNQVWTNLISNALDALDGSGTLTLSARTDDDRVVVAITDSGPGVPPELRERIFEPYFTTKPPGQGTGLGLDVSRRIVAGLGGALDVRSRPGETTFEVRLPR